jgi:serine/threonine protein kinase
MAPEVIGGQTYTEKADVFSYGIILWEIASREPPYKSIVRYLTIRYHWTISFYRSLKQRFQANYSEENARELCQTHEALLGEGARKEVVIQGNHQRARNDEVPLISNLIFKGQSY